MTQPQDPHVAWQALSQEYRRLLADLQAAEPDPLQLMAQAEQLQQAWEALPQAQDHVGMSAGEARRMQEVVAELDQARQQLILRLQQLLQSTSAAGETTRRHAGALRAYGRQASTTTPRFIDRHR